MKSKAIIVIALLTTVFCGLSCKKKNVITQATADDNKIKSYIEANNLNATATGSGLYYVIETQGKGVQPTAQSDIIINYKGYLTDGTVFDQSKAGGYAANLSKMIDGWKEGIPYFKKGGKGKLIIPSGLGYGGTATGSIPANSVLVFDIELLDVL